MCARRRASGSDNNSSGINATLPERIRPAGRKALSSRIVDRVVKIVASIATGFHYYNSALKNSILNRRKVIGPPLNCNVSGLLSIALKVSAWPRTMQFQQNDVTWIQHVGSLVNRGA